MNAIDTASKTPPVTQIGAILAEPNSLAPADPAHAAYDRVRALIAESPQADKLREALIPALAYDLEKGRDTHGAAMRDPYADPATPPMPGESDRGVVYTSPYPKMSAGAVAAVTYGMKDTGDVFVLLGRKWKDGRDHSLGLRDELVLPGGFMNPHTPNEGASSRPYDHDLDRTLGRELREETGLGLPQGFQAARLGLGSGWRESNLSPEPTVVDYRHIDMTGPAIALPQVTAGDDIGELRWIDASALRHDALPTRDPSGRFATRHFAAVEGEYLPIFPEHGDMLQKAVVKACDTLEREVSAPHRQVSQPLSVGRLSEQRPQRVH